MCIYRHNMYGYRQTDKTFSTYMSFYKHSAICLSDRSPCVTLSLPLEDISGNR